MMLLAAIDWYTFFFTLFATIACAFAAAVVLTTNIVRMAFYLTLSLGATAGLFFLAGAEFVGAMQLMIYVGGTLVLLVFGVMLTAHERFLAMRTPSGQLIVAIIVGSGLLLLLVVAAFGIKDWHDRDTRALPIAEAQTATPIGAALSGVRVDKLNLAKQERENSLSGYLLPFVIVSVHLLVVLIGAAYMARTKMVSRSGPRLSPAGAGEDDSTSGGPTGAT